jgi:release factor glutamine methyltransferase
MSSALAATRRQLLPAATATLAAAGVELPRREALRLWTEIVGAPPALSLVEGPPDVAPEDAAAFASAIRRRAAGEPLAYVTGWTGFRHLTVVTDQRALIPRPETEGLVELVLARVPRGRIADVGTGTGCIALSLATEGSYEHVVGIDRSADALGLAAENRRRTGARVSLVQGDMCEALRPNSVDALVSNPPYLTDGEYAALDRSVRAWEPGLALAGGPDGLRLVNRLLQVGLTVVRRGGWLALEVDCARAALCARRAGESGWSDIAIHADLFGRERFLLARRSDAS